MRKRFTAVEGWASMAITTALRGYSPELRREKSALFAPAVTVTMSFEREL